MTRVVQERSVGMILSGIALILAFRPVGAACRLGGLLSGVHLGRS